ncbi:hypothetical protein ACGS9J_11195 [Serratia quinivorans]
MTTKLALDFSLIYEKIAILKSLLQSMAPASLKVVEIELLKLSDDLIPVEGLAAISTDSGTDLVQRFDFGCSFDVLTAAIRAGKFDVH